MKTKFASTAVLAGLILTQSLQASACTSQEAQAVGDSELNNHIAMLAKAGIYWVDIEATNAFTDSDASPTVTLAYRGYEVMSPSMTGNKAAVAVPNLILITVNKNSCKTTAFANTEFKRKFNLDL